LTRPGAPMMVLGDRIGRHSYDIPTFGWPMPFEPDQSPDGSIRPSVGLGKHPFVFLRESGEDAEDREFTGTLNELLHHGLNGPVLQGRSSCRSRPRKTGFPVVPSVWRILGSAGYLTALGPPTWIFTCPRGGWPGAVRV
jgi:hypothetical protein